MWFQKHWNQSFVHQVFDECFPQQIQGPVFITHSTLSASILIIETHNPDVIVPTLRTVLNHISLEWQVQLIHDTDDPPPADGKFQHLVQSHGCTLHMMLWNFTIHGLDLAHR